MDVDCMNSDAMQETDGHGSPNESVSKSVVTSDSGGTTSQGNYSPEEEKMLLECAIEEDVDNKRFVCEICNKGFTQLYSLRRHARIHTGEKPYSCEVCEKTFRNLSDLRVHSRIHSGSRPYSCHVCNKTFTQSSTLVDHVRRHTGEKPYVCSVCSKAFRSRGGLHGHSKSGCNEVQTRPCMKDGPYKCNCGKEFTSRHSFSYHFNGSCSAVGPKLLAQRTGARLKLQEDYDRFIFKGELGNKNKCNDCGDLFTVGKYRSENEESKCLCAGQDTAQSSMWHESDSDVKCQVSLPDDGKKGLMSHKCKKLNASEESMEPNSCLMNSVSKPCGAAAVTKLEENMKAKKLRETDLVKGHSYQTLVEVPEKAVGSVKNPKILDATEESKSAQVPKVQLSQDGGDILRRTRLAVECFLRSQINVFDVERAQKMNNLEGAVYSLQNTMLKETNSLSKCNACKKLQWFCKCLTSPEVKCSFCNLQTSFCKCRKRSMNECPLCRNDNCTCAKSLCSSCGKTSSSCKCFRTSPSLKEGKCSFCEKKGSDCICLKSKGKTVCCKTCSRSFTRYDSLRRHMRVHTGEKPFVCRVCDKAFRNSSDLQVHFRIHSGVKPYKCMVCGKAFTQSSTLNDHIHVHTGYRPHKCQMCSKRFQRPGALLSHKCVPMDVVSQV